jgi:hypothetical protein
MRGLAHHHFLDISAMLKADFSCITNTVNFIEQGQGTKWTWKDILVITNSQFSILFDQHFCSYIYDAATGKNTNPNVSFLSQQ